MCGREKRGAGSPGRLWSKPPRKGDGLRVKGPRGGRTGICPASLAVPGTPGTRRPSGQAREGRGAARLGQPPWLAGCQLYPDQQRERKSRGKFLRVLARTVDLGPWRSVEHALCPTGKFSKAPGPGAAPRPTTPERECGRPRCGQEETGQRALSSWAWLHGQSSPSPAAPCCGIKPLPPNSRTPRPHSPSARS